MKKVRFKGNTEPCLQYDLLDETEVMEYDEVKFKKYVPCIRISVIGFVPKELMCEATHPGNVDAIDVAIELSKD